MSKTQERINVILSFIETETGSKIEQEDAKKISLEIQKCVTHSGATAEFLICISALDVKLIQLKALNSVSSLGNVIALNTKVVYVNWESVEAKMIALNEAVKLLKKTPYIPMAKTKKSFDESIVEAFTKFGLETFLDVEDLHFSLEKAKELNNEILVEWIEDIIQKQHKFVLRELFDKSVNAHYDGLLDFYNAVRPLMRALGVPEELNDHSFSELCVFNTKGWDYTVVSKIDFLSKREAKFIEKRIELEAFNASMKVEEERKNKKDENAAHWQETPKSPHKGAYGIVACIAVAFVAVFILK